VLYITVTINEPPDLELPSQREPKLSAADKRQRNHYLREFIPAMLAYVVVLLVVLPLVDDVTTAARFWVLLPLVPLVAVAVAIYRSVQRADEYGRLIQLESMALGFGAMILTSLTFGFLGIVGVALAFSGFLIFAAGMLTWALSIAFRWGDC